MAFSFSPKIVTEGLVLALDAANAKSYVSGSTVWRDLTANTVTGSFGSVTGANIFTPTGGPVPIDNSFLRFDGVNDAVFVSSLYSASAVATNNFTISTWCRPSSTHQIDVESTSGNSGISGQRYVTAATYAFAANSAGAGISVGTNGVSSYEHAASYMPALLVYSGTISSTDFTNIVLVYVNRQPQLYVNSLLVKTGLTSPKTTVNLSISLFGADESNYGAFSGDISMISFYNRSLSVQEILQNYNATKGRFGLT